MTRSAEQVLYDHGRAVNSGDMQSIVSDYAEDATILTAQGVLTGRAGAEAFLSQAFSLLPKVRVTAQRTVSAGNVATVWWSAESPPGRIDDGVDTFIVEGDLIKVQSVSFTVVEMT